MQGKAFRTTILSLAAVAMVLPSVAVADTPGDLRDLIGIRGSSSDNAMMRRGYTLAKSSDYAGYWWSNARRACVSVMVDNGRVANINGETDKQCGKGGNSNGAVAAVAIGALLVAAIAASSSRNKHDRDDDGYGHGSNYSYSPAGGITCYPRQSSCYDNGNFSSYWTRREF